MIYQSFSGDAKGGEGTFTMTGGSLAYTSATGPLFYVTNSTGYINLTGVDVTAASGVLLQAAVNDRWGKSGSNGGGIVFTAKNQTLVGDIESVKIGSVNATLQNGSTLTGAINAANTGAKINLTLDAGSTWAVTADSYLICLTDADGISGAVATNIIGNGHIVYYDSDVCPALGDQTYT